MAAPSEVVALPKAALALDWAARNAVLWLVAVEAAVCTRVLALCVFVFAVCTVALAGTAYTESAKPELMLACASSDRVDAVFAKLAELVAFDVANVTFGAGRAFMLVTAVCAPFTSVVATATAELAAEVSTGNPSALTADCAEVSALFALPIAVVAGAMLTGESANTGARVEFVDVWADTAVL